MRHAIFIGSNPSTSSATGEAFCESTKSGKMLRQWLKRADVEIVTMLNAYPHPTKDNKPPTDAQIIAWLPRVAAVLSMCRNAPVVAVGKVAAKSLTLLGVPFYELPHPSGMNRLCNDKEYVEEKLKGLASYTEASPVKSSN